MGEIEWNLRQWRCSYKKGEFPIQVLTISMLLQAKSLRGGLLEMSIINFYLILTQAILIYFLRNELGYATEVKGDPVVKVTHRFSSDMEYPAFVAAIRALFFASYRISQHSAYTAYFKPGSMFLFDTWAELKSAVATNNFWGS